MILQALVKLYEDLAAQGKIARPGWSPVQVSWALCLDAGGRLIQVIPLLEGQKNGGSTAQSMELPTPVARSVNIDSNFLWDHSGYLLGIDAKGKPERSRQCFDACRRLHEQVLDGVDSPISRAILAYFSQWQPARAAEHPALSDCLEEVRKGANLVFRVEGRFAQEDAAIRAAWQNHYDSGGDGPDMQCLVTGQMGPVARLHPAVKGVRGAQSSGASLVSFNAPAFCSYGREQSLNAPTGKYAAFAYTAALNHLLSDRAHVQRLGDTTVVFWAAGADPAYQAFSAAALFGGPPPAGLEEATLRAALKKLSRMERCAEVPLDPARPFYILGLSPNAARLSVRFFLRDCFGGFLSHVNAHHARMEIVRPANDPYETISLWALLQETVPQTVRDKSPSPVLAGATARAILSNTDYPAALLNGVMLRIRADRKITRGRAAILKAYYLKNPHTECPKEVLTVSLNETSSIVPYNLGRLFSVLEAIQQAANPGINPTIKDKYFNSASATPATIFPILNNLAQKHLKKLDTGLRIHYDRQLGQIKELLGETLPGRLSLPEQASFDLGYYHQTQKRYSK
ncbi:type I-C CRISPR-associated protein Cas8c/Csd1 [Intestinimonas massiliensis (ex Afouda et al. 2020)]|uniref:type I-C CRISPR-associated protein Cas8c/Csd1 n=1 Tax=Intestinimonas massiliensis (ex Afouda et al. 2020) TaxID=1673721 RepID=UPI00067E8F05|nr:type I-C CRISPR-associated protein Cas8c/Csd1 [Intestinimonas massiliensis (ex Afouda et al. 2020)]